MRRKLALVALLATLASSPSGAVLIAWGDGTGNTGPPTQDPVWSHVGIRGGASAVYLGDGWMLTANHVGPGPVTLSDVTYPAVADSAFQLRNADGTPADLVLFRIEGDPGLARLPIAERGFDGGTPAVLIGHGRNRGEAVCVMEARCGFAWGDGHAIRWGMNRIDGPSEPLAGGDGTVTWSFSSDFSQPRTPDSILFEAQAAQGDSGGAVFVKLGDVWELAGVMVAIRGYFQPPEVALYGNHTYAADLAVYRQQILKRAFAASCSNGYDDDGDGRVDFPEDPGCTSAEDESELAPDLQVTPRERVFGELPVGAEQTLAIELVNRGTAPLTIQSLDLQASAGLDLAEAPPLPLTLASGDEASLVMSFSPVTLGAAQGVLAIGSDDPVEPQLEVALRGTGVHQPAACIELKELKIERERDKQDDDKLEIRELELVLPDGGRLNLEDDSFALHLNGVAMWPHVPGDFDFDWDNGRGASKFKRDKVDLSAFEYAPWALVDVTSGLVRGSIVVPLEVTQDSDNDHKLEYKREDDSTCEGF